MNFANKISILRILLIPLFIACLFYYDNSRAYLRYLVLLIFVIAMTSDFADGLIARIKHQRSKVGAILDPLADKLFLVSSFIGLYAIKSLPLKVKLPFWVVLVVVSRDFIILLGIGVLFLIKIEVYINPSRWGKLTTLFQMLTILGVLAEFRFCYLVWTVAVGFTLISGFDYIRKGVLLLSPYDSKNNFRHN